MHQNAFEDWLATSHIGVDDADAASAKHSPSGSGWTTGAARQCLPERARTDALVSYQQAASIQRRLGDRSREATAIEAAGHAYEDMGRVAEATDFYAVAAGTHRDHHDQWREAQALSNLANALDRQGDTTRARSRRQEALPLLDGFDHPGAATLRHALRRQLAADSSAGADSTIQIGPSAHSITTQVREHPHLVVHLIRSPTPVDRRELRLHEPRKRRPIFALRLPRNRLCH
jgi:tetratricopeptide (TPR) repeat protein